MDALAITISVLLPHVHHRSFGLHVIRLHWKVHFCRHSKGRSAVIRCVPLAYDVHVLITPQLWLRVGIKLSLTTLLDCVHGVLLVLVVMVLNPHPLVVICHPLLFVEDLSSASHYGECPEELQQAKQLVWMKCLQQSCTSSVAPISVFCTFKFLLIWTEMSVLFRAGLWP